MRLWWFKVGKETMSDAHRIRLSKWICGYSVQLVPTCFFHRHTDLHATKGRRWLLYPRRDERSCGFARPYTQRVIPRRQRADCAGRTCLFWATVNAEGEVRGRAIHSNLACLCLCVHRWIVHLDLYCLIYVPNKPCGHRIFHPMSIHRTDLQLVPTDLKGSQNQFGVLVVHPAAVIKFVLEMVRTYTFQQEEGMVMHRTSENLSVNRRLHFEGTGDLVGLSVCFRNNTERVRSFFNIHKFKVSLRTTSGHHCVDKLTVHLHRKFGANPHGGRKGNSATTVWPDCRNLAEPLRSESTSRGRLLCVHWAIVQAVVVGAIALVGT